MSLELAHLLTVTTLAVLAGVAGFVVGGLIEVHRHNKSKSKCCKYGPPAS